jgi:hypothetical protein
MSWSFFRSTSVAGASANPGSTAATERVPPRISEVDHIVLPEDFVSRVSAAAAVDELAKIQWASNGPTRPAARR